MWCCGTKRGSTDVNSVSLNCTRRLQRQTLLHGDFKLANLLWSSSSVRPVVIDWEWCGPGAAALDVAYFIMSSSHITCLRVGVPLACFVVLCAASTFGCAHTIDTKMSHTRRRYVRVPFHSRHICTSASATDNTCGGAHFARAHTRSAEECDQ